MLDISEQSTSHMSASTYRRQSLKEIIEVVMTFKLMLSETHDMST
jgi:hypothetical protein